MLGIPVIALFPQTPASLKTEDGREALNQDNLVCRAVRAIKAAVPGIGVLCDVALDPYTSHGHDGLLRDGVILTPPQTAGILDGINRKSILQIAADLGYEAIERNLARAELYMADEVFLSGTAAELVPVREIDDHTIGNGGPGPITRDLQRVFDDALHGRDPRYVEWLDVVEVPSKAV